MDSDENEIKIEYNETNECDPLSEDVIGRFDNLSSMDQHVFDSVYKHSNVRNRNLYTNNSVKIEEKDLNTQNNCIIWFKSKDATGKLICKYCELKYSTVQTLRHHVTNKHPEEAKKIRELIINNKRNQKHVCHICKKRFKNLSALQIHTASNHSMELIKSSCINCNATFNSSEELKYHIYTKHPKGNKLLYACSICGYRTLKKSHFKQHEDTHTQNKILFCPVCDYKTSYLPNLKIHKRIHTNEKLYVCDFKGCNYSGVAKSALRSHQLKHYPKENMLFCEICSYGTVYKQSLMKHLDSHTRNVVRKKIIITSCTVQTK